MKDLNELMQSILDMDAAQRKATEDAMAERQTKQAELKKQEQTIADELAAKAKAQGQVAVQQAEAANAAALAKLEQSRSAAEQKLTATVAANRAAWVDALYKQTLGTAEKNSTNPEEVSKNAAGQ